MKSFIKYIMIFGIILYGVSIGNHFLKKIDTSNFSKFNIQVRELTDSKGWYYEIYSGNHLLIKQTNIPGVLGNQHFQNKEDARQIGLLVIHKLESQKSPSITIQDLKNCNIVFDK